MFRYRILRSATIQVAVYAALISCVVGASSVFAQEQELDKKLISEQAFKAYQLGNYERALDLYTKIGEQMPEPIPELDYNKGAVRYRMGSFEDAAKDFDNAVTAENQTTAQNSRFNLGNTFYQAKQYDKAIEQYKEALKLDPADTDSKYNLELALRQLQQQEKKSKDDKEQDKDKDKDKKDKEENKDKQDKQDKQDEQDKKDQQDKQDKQDQDKQDQQKDKQQEQNSQPDSTQSKDQQDQKQQAQPQQMSKEDAERLLNSLKDEEMKQQKRKVLLSSYRYSGKKW